MTILRLHHAGVEPELTERETAVLSLLVSADHPDADVLRASVPHLRVTGGCGCRCESYNVPDVRYRPQ
jgi:hypothetical protein